MKIKNILLFFLMIMIFNCNLTMITGFGKFFYEIYSDINFFFVLRRKNYCLSSNNIKDEKNLSYPDIQVTLNSQKPLSQESKNKLLFSQFNNQLKKITSSNNKDNDNQQFNISIKLFKKKLLPN